METSDLVKPL